MSAGPGQSDSMEDEEVIVGSKRVKRPRHILDSSDDENTSIKSQKRKRRRLLSSSVKSINPSSHHVKEDVNGKKQAKKRNLDSEEEEKKPPVKIQKKDPNEDQECSGEPSQVLPSGSQSTISDTIIQRLEFHHVLGQGGIGKVVLAENSITRRQYAVKIISKRALLAGNDEADVLVEHRVLQQASGSPFIVQAAFAIQTEMLVLLGLEYMRGGDFDKFLRSKGQLDISSARFYAAELVCGIQYLHSKGIIHRDLKPGNVLVADTGHVKITDFDLSLENMQDRTATQYAGTVGYMAPEMLAKEEYNSGVDWYSFGVILNKMITGQREYDPTLFNETSSSANDIIKQLLLEDPAKRLGVNGDIRKHHFFQSIDWVSVESLRMPPPHVPVPTKTLHKPRKFDLEMMEEEEASKCHLSSKGQAIFRGFSFINSKTCHVEKTNLEGPPHNREAGS